MWLQCRMKKMLVPVIVLAIGVVVILVGCKATRGGYESAPYRVVRADGKFELRDHPSLTVAETPMSQLGNGADGSVKWSFAPLPTPVPKVTLAIEPKNRADETKLAPELHKLADADPTFVLDESLPGARLRLTAGPDLVGERGPLQRAGRQRGLPQPPRQPVPRVRVRLRHVPRLHRGWRVR